MGEEAQAVVPELALPEPPPLPLACAENVRVMAVGENHPPNEVDDNQEADADAHPDMANVSLNVSNLVARSLLAKVISCFR